MGHLDEDALLRFVQHDLTPDALSGAEAHLRTCSLCRRAVALLAETEAGMPEPSPIPPPPKHAPRGSGWSPGPPVAPRDPPASAAHPAPTTPARRGKQIDRYEVLEVLGAGSMGVVYAAFDPHLDRKIALKMLAGDSGDAESNAEKRARMIREAQAMARLSHPNVVHVHDVGTYQDQIFVAMEFVEGQSLTRWLQAERRTWREVLRVFIRAGRGLAAAHAAGLVHRDFKPDNVMVGNDGVARVMDFGLVSSMTPDPNAWKTPAPIPMEQASEADLLVPLTQTGSLLGTPAYMAPEQWMGDKIDHRADQFAFCVSLYEALYGQRPFEAKTLSELTSKVAQGKVREVPPGSPVPFYVRRAVLRGLAADPRNRHPSMQEMLELLQLGLRVPRRRVLYSIGAAVLLVAAGLAAPSLWRLRSPQRCEQAADVFARVWDGGKERSLAGGVLAAGGPGAVEAWAHTQQFIDRFRERWIAARNRACRGAHSEGGEPQEAAQLRVECLDGELDGLRALAGVLAQPDARVVRGAVVAAAGLPSPEECTWAGLPAAIPRPPAGEPSRARWRELRQALFQARAFLAAGDAAQARRLATTVLDVVGDQDRAVKAEALLAVGAAEDAMGNASPAQESFSRAMVAAEGSGHALAGAEAALSLAEMLGARGPPEQAEFFRSMASAELERLGEDGPLRARAELVLARRLLGERRPDQAEAAVQRALAIERRLHGPEHPAVARALVVLGRVEAQRGRLQEALKVQRAAVEVLERSLGPNHPAVAAGLLGEASARLALGDSRAAVALCQRAVELARSGGLEQSPELAEAQALLASAQQQADQ